MREIKFRGWNTISNIMVDEISVFTPQETYNLNDSFNKDMTVLPLQFTGLKDKNGDKEVYECDIINSEGNIIGNQYETPTLHEDKANLLIQGFGTKNWFTTYKEAVDRGCHDA